MGQPLRMLLVEDSELDAELLLRELRRGGYDVRAQRVASAEAMAGALEQQRWDIVISDYVMPGFSGIEALQLFHDKGLDVPFIVVSGHIGEEIAVAAMQAGADDYLMKDRLARLRPAVARALEQAEIRRAHRRANAALKESEERFRQLAENVGAAFFLFERPDPASSSQLTYVSPAFEKIWGFAVEALRSKPELWLKAIHPGDRERVLGRLPEMAAGSFHEEFRVVRMDLKTRWVDYRAFPVHNLQGAVYRIAAVAEDITERKRAEELLAANARKLQNTVDELQVTQDELRQRNDELSQAREELEKRVRQRTAALAAANSELQNQMSERKRLENELLEIAENERRRIGFDLHDDLGQKLMGISLLLKALETNLAHKGLPEASETRNAQHLLHQVINHTHNLARCFSSLELIGQDLCLELKKMAANVGKTFDIACSFRMAGEPAALSAEATGQLYKIAQESVSNAIKHGKASHVSVLLARRGAGLVLRIKNDGVPFQGERDSGNRLGLRIMNYRAHLIGGEFSIRPIGNSGTLVCCAVPYVNGAAPITTPASTRPAHKTARARKPVASASPAGSLSL
jgi:PAS domain S-box-containing protein